MRTADAVRRPWIERTPVTRPHGLWHHRDFRLLWAGQTISVFGTMISGTALPFTAILLLDATPLEVAVLAAARIVPALLAGFVAGVWMDRVRRRPLMIAADIARAALLVSVPLAWAFDGLHIEQLYAVALGAGVLSMFFDVAYESYLPTLVSRDELLEGNSKLTASNAVSEFAGFSVSGWLVQLLNGPLAILIDAATFIASAFSIGAIRAGELPPAAAEQRANALRESIDGMRYVAREPLLRAMAGGVALSSFGFGIFGATYMLFVTRSLGFDPGVLGLIFGLGGLSSLGGALLARRAGERAGVGPAMVLGLGAMGGSMLLVPAAHAATAVGAAMLIGQQLLGDGAYTAYDVNQVSLRQTIASEAMRGRVSASMRTLEMGLLLAGTLTGGLLAETVGLRPTLVLGACIPLAGAVVLFLSPLRDVRSVGGVGGDGTPIPVEPAQA